MKANITRFLQKRRIRRDCIKTKNCILRCAKHYDNIDVCIEFIKNSKRERKSESQRGDENE